MTIVRAFFKLGRALKHKVKEQKTRRGVKSCLIIQLSPLHIRKRYINPDMWLDIDFKFTL